MRNMGDYRKSEKIYDGITNIRDDLVDHAQAHKPKKRKKWWPAAAAAVVAAAIIGTAVLWPGGNPVVTPAYAIATAEYPQMAPYPNEMDYTKPNGEFDSDGFYEAWNAWWEDQNALATNADWPVLLQGFLTSSTEEFLSGAGTDNLVYSPVNVYMALAMLAETTGGNSRQQILDLLGEDSIESLRSSAHALWGECYRDDGAVKRILANSLWLNEDVEFVRSTMDTLAQNYYASSFQGKMGSDELNKALQSWLNEQTGGLLEEQASQMEMDPDTILALASTIYFQGKWNYEFLPSFTKEGVFHGASGDTTCDFMHENSMDPYFWGDNFSAISRNFVWAGSMWFILPDEGVSIDELLHDGQTMEFLLDPWGWENQKYLIVNESIPKFDVSSQLDLRAGLRSLGVTDVFDVVASDFTPMTQDTDEIYLSQAEHAARVTIDERGCTAAAFTVMMDAGGGAPADDEVDFVLDRPFLFVIMADNGLPLFVGVVNQL